MSARARRSPSSRTAARNDRATSARDRSAHMSEIGFAPRYGTRRSGGLRANASRGPPPRACSTAARRLTSVGSTWTPS
ncbi:hypothetical protein [Actinomadura kijaniata]|uniref:hypothetical protein n=1 Tax=Actinomadura kijaniata TaxID=46161 RepID=UPI00082C3757|nr:hypothetical protein [Actinomadura kijaniata]